MDMSPCPRLPVSGASVAIINVRHSSVSTAPTPAAHSPSIAPWRCNMTILAVEIRRLDPQTAPDAEWRALNTLNNILEAEFFPDDPPEKLETTIKNVRDVPAYVDVRRWHAWQGDEIVGRGVFSIWSPNDNLHMADF